jgi:hypothetical protein
MTPAQRRGYLFEVRVRQTLRRNGWAPVTSHIPDHVRITGQRGVEIRGRGTWHQIDAPACYAQRVPFMFPLRLLVEAKAHGKPIEKRYIRQFIGVVSDISQNYVVDPSKPHLATQRYTDVGAFFSVSGFQREATRLAYAHGIKTVSYGNSPQLERFFRTCSVIADHADWPNDTTVRRAGGREAFMEQLISEITTAESELRIEDPMVAESLRSLTLPRSSVIATTASDSLLVLTSEDDFPDELFFETDTRTCRVSYNDETQGSRPTIWLTIDGAERRQFYFDIPAGLENAIATGADILDEKKRTFTSLQLFRRINGLIRLLNLNIDTEWLDQLRRDRIQGAQRPRTLDGRTDFGP